MMAHNQFVAAKQFEKIRSYEREIKEKEKEQQHRELVSEVEKATGKKLIIVDDVEYYVDPLKLEQLIGATQMKHPTVLGEYTTDELLAEIKHRLEK